MKRHDTHLLSDSEEMDEKSDEKHKYSNNFSFNNSENNSFYSNYSKKESPFKLNALNPNNNDNNCLSNISIISSKELEDIFFNEKNYPKNKKEENKEIQNVDYSRNKMQITKNQKNVDKLNIKESNKEIGIKREKKGSKIKDKDGSLFKMIKLNKINNEIIINFYTYTPSLNDNGKKRIKQKQRKCISLNNSFIGSKNKIIKLKNTTNKYSVKSAKKKKSKSKIENINFNNIINDELDEDETNIQNLIDIINHKKLKLKISKNSFSIKKKIINPLILDEYQKDMHSNQIRKNNYPFLFKHKIQHQNDFYLERDNKYYNLKRRNYFPLNKFQINGKNAFQYIQQEKKLKENYYSSLNLLSSNNSRFSNSNNKNSYLVDTLNKYNKNEKLNKSPYLKFKNDKKIKILYELYCKKPETQKRNIAKIKKSTSSIKENNLKKDFYKKMSEIDLLNNHFDFKTNNINDNYAYNNKKYWLLRLIKLQKVKNMYEYNKHYGSIESCPLCKDINKKNVESIKKKGICFFNQENKKNESKTSLYNRRINSAYTKSCWRNKNEASKSDIIFENDNDLNKSKNLHRKKSRLNSAIVNEKYNRNRKRFNFDKKNKFYKK